VNTQAAVPPTQIATPTATPAATPTAVAEKKPAAKPLPPTGLPPARLRKRHHGAFISFVVMVLLPVLVAGWYLWDRAADRYVSTVAFSVRSADTSSAMQLLSGLGQLAGSSSSSDTDILYQFIQSQELVGKIDDAIDLRAIWSRADPAVDPLYAFHVPGTIEDLMRYWPRMVKVYNTEGAGILNVTVQAFTAEDARQIATQIYENSSERINALSVIARNDATRYAREDRDEAVDRLKQAREALTLFRNRTQIVDPTASVQNQMGLLSSLQAQLAETLINQAILKDSVPADDPRMVQADRRIQVIRAQIAAEQKTLGIGAGGSGAAGPSAFADLVGEYERLTVVLQFAEQTYTAAMSAYDGAAAESRRQTRYLAAHIQPTLAEAAEQPHRMTLLFLTAMFAFLLWAVSLLVFYSLKDRR